MKNVFEISAEHVQYLAREKMSRESSTEELHQVRKGVELGLECCWEQVVVTAIRETVDDR